VNFGNNSYFITIAETGNITKASEILHVSQPSLSQYVSKIEKKLSVKLIERNYTPLRLTEAGKIFLDYVKGCEELDELFLKRLQKFSKTENKLLSVGIPLQITTKIFSQLLGDFLKETPDIQLSIKGGTSLDMITMLLNEEVEIAFAHTLSLKMSGLMIKKLGSESLHLVCNNKNSIARRHSRDNGNVIYLSENEIREVENQRIIVLSKEYLLYKKCEEYFNNCKLFPQKVIELSDLNAILDCVSSNNEDLVAFLPESSYKNNLDKNKYSILNINDIQSSWYFAVCQNTTKPLSYYANMLWEEADRLKADKIF